MKIKSTKKTQLVVYSFSYLVLREDPSKNQSEKSISSCILCELVLRIASNLAPCRWQSLRRSMPMIDRLSFHSLSSTINSDFHWNSSSLGCFHWNSSTNISVVSSFVSNLDRQCSILSSNFRSPFKKQQISKLANEVSCSHSASFVMNVHEKDFQETIVNVFAVLLTRKDKIRWQRNELKRTESSFSRCCRMTEINRSRSSVFNEWTLVTMSEICSTTLWRTDWVRKQFDNIELTPCLSKVWGNGRCWRYFSMIALTKIAKSSSTNGNLSSYEYNWEICLRFEDLIDISDIDDAIQQFVEDIFHLKQQNQNHFFRKKKEFGLTRNCVHIEKHMLRWLIRSRSDWKQNESNWFVFETKN